MHEWLQSQDQTWVIQIPIQIGSLDEPNDVGTDPGEDYADMEINRSGRTDGGWNDLPLRPTVVVAP